MRKNLFLLLPLTAIASVFYSCVLSSEMVQDQPKHEPAKDIVREEVVEVTPEELIINEDIEESRFVEIYKGEIQDNCERKYLDILNYYKNGELSSAKLLFDNLLESLEYIYGDKKYSDKVMLQNFWDEFSDQSVKDSSPNLFELYESLYYDDDILEKEKDTNELVIEQKTEVYQVKQNNANFTYVEEKTKGLFEKSGIKATDDFTKSVYDYYAGYLSDRIGIKETYIRSQKYMKFIKSKLSENGLNEIFSYLPAATTSFYEGSKNGSIWRLENTKEYRNIRNDIGASTAEVIRKIKTLSVKGNEFNIISTILEEGRYNFEKTEIRKDIFTGNLANFIALTIILSNPGDHDLSGVGLDNEDENKYFSSYESYIKDPKKFTVTEVKEKEQPKKEKYSKTFIRINYKVRKGDNLQKIADLFNVTVSDLKEWNPKDTGKKHLAPGVNLLIKGFKYQYYTAKSGDSVGKIAKKFGMTESDFKKINGLSKNTVFKGRKYIVKKN